MTHFNSKRVCIEQRFYQRLRCANSIDIIIMDYVRGCFRFMLYCNGEIDVHTQTLVFFVAFCPAGKWLTKPDPTASVESSDEYRDK